MSNEEIDLGAIRRRDRAAWASLYDSMVYATFALIWNLIGGESAACEDLNQETWLTALDAIESYDPDRKPQSPHSVACGSPHGTAGRVGRAVSGESEDPMVMWPHLMPEFNSRPHLWTTLDSRSFEFEPIPDDGPEGSVRVIVRTDDPVVPIRGRYWCEPDHGFCVVKAIEPVIKKENGKRKLDYMNTEVFEKFSQTPSGLWYPRQSRRTTSAAEITQVRQYFLDFDVNFDDELFDPLELNE